MDRRGEQQIGIESFTSLLAKCDMKPIDNKESLFMYSNGIMTIRVMDYMSATVVFHVTFK